MGEEPEEILEPDGLSRSLKSGLYDTNYTVLNTNFMIIITLYTFLMYTYIQLHIFYF